MYREVNVKKLLLIPMLVVVLFGQEALTRVKISREAESILAATLDELPRRIEVFMAADGVFVVEAVYEDQKLIRRYSAVEYHEMLARAPARIVTLETARVPYLIGQTVLGIGVYSWALPVALDLEDNGAVAVGLFTPLVYASAQFFFTRGDRMSGGAAYGSFLGGLEGGVHGGLLFKSVRAVLPASLGENLLDLALAQTMDFTPAMYQRKFNHALAGYYHYAALRTLVAGWEDHEFDVFLQPGTVFSLAEGYAALFLSRKAGDLTYGDALFELRTAVIGAEALPFVLATYDLHRHEESNERVYAAVSLAGYGLGYLLGQKLTREYDLTGASGFLTWLIPYLAHGATGGLVALTESEGLARSYPAIFMTVDIALTYVCYRAFAQKATRLGKIDGPKFNVAVNPAAIVFRDMCPVELPVVSVEYHF